MAKKQKVNLLDLKIKFNNFFLRESGFYVNDNDYLCIYNDDDLEEIIKIKDKFIKVTDDEFPILSPNEIDLNLIENPKFCETLLLMWWERNVSNKLLSIEQNSIDGSFKGLLTVTYLKNGLSTQISSDPYVNESVRVFNLICKIVNRTHLYNFNELDVKIERDK